MMTTVELLGAIDSIAVRVDKRTKELSNYLSGYLSFEDLDSTYIEIPEEKERYKTKLETIEKDTVPKNINLSPSAGAPKIPKDINKSLLQII